MKPSKFSPDQDAAIRELYPDSAAIAALMPDFNTRQIRNRAHRLGVTRKSETVGFSDAEDARIRENYPEKARCLAAIPGRAWAQIRKRASYLKSSRDAGSFTACEDESIARLFPDFAAIRATMPGRTKLAIKHRAITLGVHKSGQSARRYSEAERRLIRIFYPNYNVLSALLAPRKRESIKALAVMMRLTTGRRGCGPRGYTTAWTPDEIARLAEPGLELPGRSASAINGARQRMNIRVGGPRTVSEQEKAGRLERRAQAHAEAEARGITLKALLAERIDQRAADKASEAEKAVDGTARAAPRTAGRKATAPAQTLTVHALLAQSSPAHVDSAEQLRAEVQAAREDRYKAKLARRREARRAASAAKRAAVPPAPIKRHIPANAPTMRAAPPRPVAPPPRPVMPQHRDSPGLNPRVIAAASRSRYGLDLVADVQRAVPRDVWPSVKPRVIEDVVLAVVEGRCERGAIPSFVPGAIQAAMRSQFQGVAHV